MLNGCMTSKSSSPSSTVSMMSPSSLHSSPQASSSFSQDRSPVSSPSRTTFQSVPLIKPSAIKDPAVHFTPSTIPSMCFPLHAIYAQNPYSGIVGNNLSTFFSPHAIARQMSFLGNSFSQNALSGKRIPPEDFSRFPPVFSPLNTAHRTANASYQTAKQGCLFPFNSAHSSGVHHLHNAQNNMFNSLNNDCLTSSPPFKRKMLNISGDSDLTPSTPNDSASVQSTTIGSNNWCRSPSQPLICPLCSVSLEGIDINIHFLEEVNKAETLRKLSDFAYIPNESESNEQFESRCSSFHKKLPYSRWETFQRVKQNRHSRLTAMIRQTKRKFESEEMRNESRGNSMLRNDNIWSIGSDISTASQKNEDEDENDSSSEKNVDVVSDIAADNEKEAECEKSSDGGSSVAQNRDSAEIAKSRNEVTDGEEIKPLENGLTSQSNIQNNSDIENIHETIDILRKRIRELENKENDSNNNDSTCFICSNPFTKPVVSVGCWHVHCEQCWLSVVETKRLCPQCDTVVTSRDLRRVFLN